jgi:hypothetical protein
MKSKHGLSQADLDIILFLYSEGYFGRIDFVKFAELVSWELDRFKRLWKYGWIEHFRKGTGRTRAIYQLSPKAKNVVLDIYRKLNGEEIPTSLSYNPMFLKNVKYTDKVYRTMILQMNAYNKQKRKEAYSKEAKED